jgi:hypothetical protein
MPNLSDDRERHVIRTKRFGLRAPPQICTRHEAVSRLDKEQDQAAAPIMTPAYQTVAILYYSSVRDGLIVH